MRLSIPVVTRERDITGNTSKHSHQLISPNNRASLIMEGILTEAPVKQPQAEA